MSTQLTSGFRLAGGGAISHIQPGDIVVFARHKTSTSPGVRARDIAPAMKGDTYSYVVDKYWIVAEVLNDDRLRLLTRTGKEHLLDLHDHRIRRPSFWERLFMKHKFPSRQILDRAASSDRQLQER